MRVIELDAAPWTTILDFYEALLAALGAPHWHGRNINALIDSMVFGGINEIDPPYTVRIVGGIKLTSKLREEIKFEIGLLMEGRDQAYAPGGGDVQLFLETDF